MNVAPIIGAYPDFEMKSRRLCVSIKLQDRFCLTRPIGEE